MDLNEEEQTPYGLHFVRSDEHAYPVKNVYAVSSLSTNAATSKQSSKEEDQDREGQGRDQYLSLDSRAAHLWTQRGRERHRICFPKFTSGYISSFTQVAKSGLLIASAINMRLIVYDRNMNFCGTALHTERTFASICFDDVASRLATSGMDGIAFWDWIETKSDPLGPTQKRTTSYNLKLFKRIKNTAGWTSQLHINCKKRELFIPNGAPGDEPNSEGDMLVVDLDSGELKHHLKNLQRAGITSCVYSASSSHLVTGGNDGLINLWLSTQSYRHVYTLLGHTRKITGLQPHQISGLIISSSLDSTIRVWNAESCQQVYCISMADSITGLMVSGRHAVLSISNCVQVWKLDHVSDAFAKCRSQVQSLKRFISSSSSSFSSSKNESSGVLMVQCEDMSTRLISCADGESKTTLVPEPRARDARVDVMYDQASNLFFSVLLSGDILVHRATTNPAECVARWRHVVPNGDVPTCATLCGDYLTIGTKKGLVHALGVREILCQYQSVSSQPNSRHSKINRAKEGGDKSHLLTMKAHNYSVQRAEVVDDSTFVTMSVCGELVIWKVCLENVNAEEKNDRVPLLRKALPTFQIMARIQLAKSLRSAVTCITTSRKHGLVLFGLADGRFNVLRLNSLQWCFALPSEKNDAIGNITTAPRINESQEDVRDMKEITAIMRGTRVINGSESVGGNGSIGNRSGSIGSGSIGKSNGSIGNSNRSIGNRNGYIAFAGNGSLGPVESFNNTTQDSINGDDRVQRRHENEKVGKNRKKHFEIGSSVRLNKSRYSARRKQHQITHPQQQGIPAFTSGMEEEEKAVSAVEAREQALIAVRAAIFCDALQLVVTVGLNGVVRVWDTDRRLLRELCMDTPLFAVTLRSDNGDLLLGTETHVSRVPVAAWLPSRV